MSSNSSDAQQMMEVITSPMKENEIKRVNLLTTNIDDTVDCEIEIIVVNPIPFDVDSIMNDVVTE